MQFFRRGIIALTLVLLPLAASAYDIPVNDGFVTDEAHLLTSDQEATLEQNLDQYRKTTSNEIAILTMPSLSGADIAQFSVDVGRKWGVGTKQNNNGILMVISYADHQINIATGYGLEGAVPDIVAKGIIDTDVIPRFRQGNYYEGITTAVDSLQKHIAGEYTAKRYEVQSSGFTPWIFFIFFIFLNWIGAFLARSKSWWMGGVLGGVFGVILTILYIWWVTIPLLIIIGLAFDYLLSRAGPRGRGGRGGFGGFGGGGFGGGSGGFGGGSFGGGGASGRW
jgi:uncharacterized protein